MLSAEQVSAGGSGPAVWRIRGDLDASAVPLFHALAPVVQPGGATVVLDVSSLQFLDSRGLAAIVAWIRRCHDADVAVAICCAKPFMTRLLHIAGIEAIAPLGRTPAEALARLGQHGPTDHGAGHRLSAAGSC